MLSTPLSSRYFTKGSVALRLLLRTNRRNNDNDNDRCDNDNDNGCCDNDNDNDRCDNDNDSCDNDNDRVKMTMTV